MLKFSVNEKKIMCVSLEKYDKSIVECLKKNGFRYYSVDKTWSMLGFNDLEVFKCYVNACINGDSLLMKQYAPKKDILVKQARELKACNTSKKAWIDKKNAEKIEEIASILDKGCGEIALVYYQDNRKDFWSASISEIKKTLKENHLVNDCVEFNLDNNVNCCKWLIDNMEV